MILRMNATHRAGERRGAILLIVLTLLALFAVVALSFALYAESEALAARIRREAMSVSANPDPLPAANSFLQQMLFTPASDVGNDTLSALRGHEMARLIYGGASGNSVPYNGIGTFSEALTLPYNSATSPVSRQQVINFMLQHDRDATGNYVRNPNNSTGLPVPSHVVDPENTGFRNSAQFGAAPTTTYVGKNAPYTYPDRNNMCIAVQDPNTGRIVLLSYHRPTLFNTTRTNAQSWLAPPGANGITIPANEDWLNDIGRYKILRPRPIDHLMFGEAVAQSQFPYPPPNPDGTITGDVQNIIGTDGVQRHDAVWLNANLPVINWRGRNIIPLVAATVLPLDGRVNVNTAGNVNGGTSHHGFGPYEINAGQFLSDAAAMNTARLGTNTPNPRNTGLTTAAFGMPQGYAKVNWDAKGGAMPMVMPSAYQSDPTFGASGYGDAMESNNHPSLFNPFSWDSGSAPGKLFPHTDLRRAATRYSGTQSDYNDPFFKVLLPSPSPPPSLSGFGLQNPSNVNRALVTTISNSIHRAGLQPNYLDYTVGALQLNAGVLSRGPATMPATPPPAIVVGAATDFNSGTQLSSKNAQLGAVDLNRPLADYRAATAPTGALSQANLTNRIAAETDRQTLARDIFVRLIVATGAKAIINPVAGTIELPQPTAVPGVFVPATTQPEYDALRYLAQLAANAVDYIDNDDINTSFVWNPTPVTPPTIPITGQDATSLSPAQALLNFAATAINDRVVFGVEKPRVLLNEVYAEIANDPSDSGSNKANSDFKLRFWIELSNPGGTTSPADPNQALGDTSVALRNTVASVYRIDVHDNGDTLLRPDLFNPALAASNVAGTTTSMPKLSFDFTGATATDATAINNPFEGYGSNAAPPPGYGFRLVGPKLMAPGSGTEFLPDATMPPYDRMIQIPATGVPLAVGVPNALEYTVTKVQPANIAGTVTNLANHAVVLRRLANPYIAFNDTPTAINPIYNPYITVDVFHDVAARDGIRVGANVIIDGTRPAGQPTATNTRTSLGRQTPYYGHRDFANPANTFEAPQVGQPAMPVGLNGASNPLTSFFNHNSNFTVPAEWLTHMDRPLINQMELLHIPGVKPHELTYKFTTGNTGAPVYHQHVAQWTSPTVPLHRALELLTVKTWMNGVPNGGRTPGKINVNSIWSQKVLEALLDQNVANKFTTAEVSMLWTTLFSGTTSDTANVAAYVASTRTKEWQPTLPMAIPSVGPTFDEVGPTYLDGGVTRGSDRPIKSLGTATFVAAPGGLLPNGSGIDDTILRNGAAGTPAIFGAATHPYEKAEMLRKMQNNFTTTTDTYMVVMTVGYFEVRNSGPISPTNPVVLGKEVFDEIPGDMRAKFCAVVDRSMLGFDPNPVPPGTPTQMKDFWMSETATGTPAVTPTLPPTQFLQFRANGNMRVNYEGHDVNVLASARLIVGTGATVQTVTVGVAGYAGYDANGNGMFTDPGDVPALPGYDPNTGIATITVTGLTAVVPPGTSISNGTLGNPGAQPNFDASDTRYSGVVPYFGRIYPR